MNSVIVVARFNENLDWLLPARNVIVYNKGANDIDVPYIPLPNVGRESHSYVTFILDNWNNLPDVTMFIQGDIKDHSSGDPRSYIVDCIQQAKVHGLSQNMHSIEFEKCIYNFGPEHCNNIVAPFKNMVLGQWINSIINVPHNCVGIKWYHGAIFAASRNAIRAVPMGKWMQIKQSLEYANNPVTAHYFERSIYFIITWFMAQNHSML